ncbi:MAG TPA: serine/threonine-protein kinase [Anaeromyxobacteraceae bacterium]|nr:serine/threonine-protein kinase [Anaeromyxobacteraceae bacterium]
MRIGSYEVEALIGRGGMAEVFCARVVGGPRAGSPVALKRLLSSLADDEGHVALFAREACLAAQLHHPAIVEVFEAGVEGGKPFIAMEYIDGSDLRRLIGACRARAIQLPLDFALYVAHVLAQALDYAHRARGDDGKALGVVHCDVSPSNVFISRSGEVKLGDFGVARAAGDGKGRAVFGKVRYLAPEQLRGERIGPGADVFALGAVLHELLTGRPAFPDKRAEEVADRILSGVRRPPSMDRPEVPPQVDEVVVRSLALEHRYRDAAELARDLEARYDPTIGTPLAIAALARGVLGT